MRVRNRWILAGIAAVAMVGVAGAGLYGYRAWKDETNRVADCETIQTQIAERGEVVRVDGEGMTVAVLGDSYSSGDGLTDWQEAWPYQLQRATGLNVEVAGIGMTGYINGGFCGDQTFASRIGTVLATDPDLLVVQGGINDWKASEQDIAAAANALLDAAGSTPVVLVGPTDSPRRPGAATVDATLERVASERGVTYVRTFDEDSDYLPDELHLTPAGHSAFADEVAAALPDAG